MTANIGTIDRVLRLLAGIILIAVPFIAGPTLAPPAVLYGAAGVGAVLVLTALVRFCPLYRLVGLRTCRA